MVKSREGPPTEEESEPEKEKFEERELERDFEVPSKVKDVLVQLKGAGHEAYLIGGCVRDEFTGHEQHDWDMTSNAKPEDIVNLFPTTYDENDFGTVTIVNESEPVGSPLRDVEVTPYRKEEDYSDNRHPDEVEFADDISEDLRRRDFTINAMAVRVDQSGDSYIIDAYGGKEDIEEGIIRAVGDPEERFGEDALRIIRGVRFSSKLNFEIEENTEKAMKNKKKLLDNIANERIRDEILKMIKADNPEEGVELLEELGLLKYLAYKPGEASEEAECSLANDTKEKLRFASENRLDEDVKKAILFSNIRKKEEENEEKRSKELMKALKFPNEDVDRIQSLVEYSDFNYEEGNEKETAKKIMKELGRRDAYKLIDLRETKEKVNNSNFDISSLVKIRKRIEQSKNDPLEVKDLAIGGEDIKNNTELEEGRAIGHILKVLTYEVFQNSSENKEDNLIEKVKKLADLDEDKLENKKEEALRKMSLDVKDS